MTLVFHQREGGRRTWCGYIESDNSTQLIPIYQKMFNTVNSFNYFMLKVQRHLEKNIGMYVGSASIT